MTDALRPVGRTFPGRAIPGRALPDLPTADVRPAVRAASARVAAQVKRPYHLGTLLGVSACAYAVSLAGVTWLQASSEAATTAERAPALTAIEQMTADNDRLEQTIAAIRDRLGVAGDDYTAAVAALAAYEAQLDALSGTVADVEAMALQLPTRIAVPTRSRASLPSVSRPAAAAKPSTVATTGASGG